MPTSIVMSKESVILPAVALKGCLGDKSYTSGLRVSLALTFQAREDISIIL